MTIVAETMTTVKQEQQFGTLWQLVAQPGAVVEVRALLKTASEYRRVWTGFGSTVTGYFDDPAAFAKSLAALDECGRATSIYVTLNPVAPDLLARAANRLIAAKSGETTSDDQIIRRVWLLIDCDPIRPSGISATPEEIAAARARAQEIADHLTRLGWPAPVLTFSGNGWHLLYRIDLPNDADSKELIHAVLNALQLQFGDKEKASDIGADLEPGQIGVKIDQTVFNAARITKAYGTMARKGDDLSARPHRLSYIESIPDSLEPVSPSQLDAVATVWRSYEAALRTPASAAPAGNGNGGEWEAIIDQWRARHPLENQLTAYAYTNKGGNRWGRPGNPDSKCVLVDRAEQKAHSFADNDPMSKYARFNSFDLFVEYEHKGDRKAAAIAAKKELGLWEEKPADPVLVWSNGANAEGATAEAKPGKVSSASGACLKILADMGYSFAWNELDDTIEVNGERLNSGIEAQIRTKMRDQGWKGMEALQDVWTSEAYNNRYHPMRRYFEGLEWDGENHIVKLATYIKDAHPLIVYPSGQASSVFLIWFVRWAVGAIAKLYESGAVRGQNPMLVLDGGQNLGKSTFVRWLASPFPDLFIEAAIRPDDKEDLRYLTSKFVWEVSELGATTRRADREALKAFITKGEATYRKPYDRNPIVKPALASFVGTINNEIGFLTDKTGNRRFLAVTLKSMDWRYADEIDINQVWAQAYHLYQTGEPWQLNATEVARRDGLNTDYELEDSLEGWVRKVAMIDPDQNEWRATSTEITNALQTMGVKGTTRAIQMELGSTLKSMGLRQDSNARPRQWIGVLLNSFLDSSTTHG